VISNIATDAIRHSKSSVHWRREEPPHKLYNNIHYNSHENNSKQETQISKKNEYIYSHFHRAVFSDGAMIIGLRALYFKLGI